jgi:hypothetical protein
VRGWEPLENGRKNWIPDEEEVDPFQEFKSLREVR